MLMGMCKIFESTERLLGNRQTYNEEVSVSLLCQNTTFFSASMQSVFQIS